MAILNSLALFQLLLITVQLVSNSHGIFVEKSVTSDLNSANVKNYPVWKIKQNNQIDLQPIPIFLVYPDNAKKSDSQSDNTVNNGNTASTNTAAISDDIKQLAALIGVDPSMLPSLEMAMDLLGTTSEIETIKAIREIASTPEGIELIRSFIVPNDLPADEGTVDNESVRVDPALSVPSSQKDNNYNLPSAPFSLNGVAAPNLDNKHTDYQILRNVIGPRVVQQTNIGHAANASPSLLTRIMKFFSFPSLTSGTEPLLAKPVVYLPQNRYYILPPSKPLVKPYFYNTNTVPQQLIKPPLIFADQLSAYGRHDIQPLPSVKQYTMVVAPDGKKRPDQLMYLKKSSVNGNRDEVVNPVTKPIRNTSHDFYATGKIHRAKPDAIQLLPLQHYQRTVAAQNKNDGHAQDLEDAMIDRINNMTIEVLNST